MSDMSNLQCSVVKGKVKNTENSVGLSGYFSSNKH